MNMHLSKTVLASAALATAALSAFALAYKKRREAYKTGAMPSNPDTSDTPQAKQDATPSEPS